MSFKQPAIAVAAAALFAIAGAASASAQGNCGRAYQQVMRAYQVQSPDYAQILDEYNARCLSGSSQPAWQGNPYQGYGNPYQGYGNPYQGDSNPYQGYGNRYSHGRS